MVKAFYIIPFLVTSLFAQVPNHSFENWIGTEPDGWQTTNLPIVPQSILKDTESYSGSFCVKGTVVTNNFNQPFPPYLGYSGPTAQGFNILIPYSHFEGFCKLNLLYGDKFSGIVHVYNSNHEPIATGQITMSGIIAQWQQFSIDINYDSIDVNMSCAVFFTITDSTGSASGHEGSTFWLDLLSMSGVAIAGIPHITDNNYDIYPNPATDYIHIRSDFSTPDSYDIYDAENRLIRNGNLANGDIDVSDLKEGIYFFVIRSREKTLCERILISR
jgi:hypothetical protein